MGLHYETDRAATATCLAVGRNSFKIMSHPKALVDNVNIGLHHAHLVCVSICTIMPRRAAAKVNVSLILKTKRLTERERETEKNKVGQGLSTDVHSSSQWSDEAFK